jgi:hypothetical protein
MKLSHKKNSPLFGQFGHLTFPLKKTHNTPKLTTALKLTKTTTVFTNYPTKEHKTFQIEAETKRNQAQTYASTTPIR